MIIDQLFEEEKKKTLNEIDPRNYDSDEDYYNDLHGDKGDDEEDFDVPDDDVSDMDHDEESYYEKSLRSRGLGEQGMAEGTRERLSNLHDKIRKEKGLPDPKEYLKIAQQKKKEIADLKAQDKKDQSNTSTAATENAQKSMPFYGTNPATGQARTYDELLAKSQAGAAPATPNFAPQGGGYKSMKTSINLPAPATPTSTSGTGGTYDKKTGAATLGGKPMIAAKDLPLHIQKQLSGIKEALTQPVAELLQMVETKEDVQKIKQFVDQTFIRYGAVNESAFALRNQILEHVTQAGAQRRREHSQRVAH